MWFEQVMFFVAALGALAGALGVVILRNPFYSVLALVAHLISLAALFLLLRAEFLAAAQVVVYAGAVMVLYVFVVAYIGGVEEPLGGENRALKTLGPLFAGALLIEIALAVVGTGLQAIDSRGPEIPAESSFGAPAHIGQLLLERYLLAFESVSFLLLLAAVGAVVLAGRRRGLEEVQPETLPERFGKGPGPPTDQGAPSVPGEDEPTMVPSGTAEGATDPAVQQSPDHETQEKEKQEEPVSP